MSTRTFSRLGFVLIHVAVLVTLAACGPEITSQPHTANSAATPEATALQMTTVAGQTVNLADYENQIVLVNFWATWCTPCRTEMPVLDAYYQAHRADGFMLLAVNAGEPSGRVAEFIATQEFAFPIVLDEEGHIAAHFGGIRAMPTSFLLDEQGKVQQQFFGAIEHETLEAVVTPLLATGN